MKSYFSVLHIVAASEGQEPPKVSKNIEALDDLELFLTSCTILVATCEETEAYQSLRLTTPEERNGNIRAFTSKWYKEVPEGQALSRWKTFHLKLLIEVLEDISTFVSYIKKIDEELNTKEISSIFEAQEKFLEKFLKELKDNRKIGVQSS